MRAWWVLAVICLAGCLQTPPSTDAGVPPAAGLHAFDATYTQRHNGGAMENLLVSLLPPVEIMDRDEQVRHAYPLHIRMAEGLQDHIFYLDGELRVVRTDQLCGFMQRHEPPGACYDSRFVRWDVQGSHPPLGFAWQELASEGQLPSSHLGLPLHHDLVQEAGWTYLRDAPDPNAWLLHPGDQVRFDGEWLPEQMLWNLGVGALAYEYEATLLDVQWHDELPIIPAWPRSAGPARTVTPSFFDTSGESFFGMQSTYQEAFTALLQAVPAAGAAMDGGCVVQFDALPVESQQVVADIHIYDESWVQFHATIADSQGNLAAWDWDYHQTTPRDPLQDLARTRYENFREGNSAPMRLPCIDVVAHDRVSPGRLMQEAWRLPTHAGGLPCGFSYERSTADNIGLTEMGPLRAVAYLAEGVVGGKPGNHMEWFYKVAQDPSTGLWSWMYLPQSDVTALDGGLAHREPRVIPAADTYGTSAGLRCVEPVSAAS